MFESEQLELVFSDPVLTAIGSKCELAIGTQIREVKQVGYNYHSDWFNLPRFIRKTAKELAPQG